MLVEQASVDTAVLFCATQMGALEALWDILEVDEYT